MASDDHDPDQRRRDDGDASDPDGADRDESPTERADRNWNELLQELRVTETGVQILTGFLLTLPFQQRFGELGSGLRVVYLVALTLAVTSTGLVVAPVVWHRLLFRRHAKTELVSAADRITKAGLVTIGLTVVAAVAVVFGFVAGPVAATVAGVTAFAFFLVQWLVVPRRMARRLVRARPRVGD